MRGDLGDFVRRTTERTTKTAAKVAIVRAALGSDRCIMARSFGEGEGITSVTTPKKRMDAEWAEMTPIAGD